MISQVMSSLGKIWAAWARIWAGRWAGQWARRWAKQWAKHAQGDGQGNGQRDGQDDGQMFHPFYFPFYTFIPISSPFYFHFTCYISILLEVPDRGRRHLGPSGPHGPARLPAYAPRCCTYSHTHTPLQSFSNTQLRKVELTPSVCLAVSSQSARSHSQQL